MLYFSFCVKAKILTYNEIRSCAIHLPLVPAQLLFPLSPSYPPRLTPCQWHYLPGCSSGLPWYLLSLTPRISASPVQWSLSVPSSLSSSVTCPQRTSLTTLLIGTLLPQGLLHVSLMFNHIVISYRHI